MKLGDCIQHRVTQTPDYRLFNRLDCAGWANGDLWKHTKNDSASELDDFVKTGYKAKLEI